MTLLHSCVRFVASCLSVGVVLALLALASVAITLRYEDLKITQQVPPHVKFSTPPIPTTPSSSLPPPPQLSLLMSHPVVAAKLAHACPVVMAHRGTRTMNPENTLLAHQTAASLGADVLEFDVRKTKDGVLVVHHDITPARCMGPTHTRPIETMTLAELKLLDAGYMYTADGGVSYPLRGRQVVTPTLHEMLTEFHDMPLSIEMKENDFTVAEELVKELALWPEGGLHVLVASRWCAVLRYFRWRTQYHFATSTCETEAMLFFVMASLQVVPYVYDLTPARSSLHPPLSNEKKEVEVLWWPTVKRALRWALLPLPFDSLQLPVWSGPVRVGTQELIRATRQAGVHVYFWVVNDADELLSLTVNHTDSSTTTTTATPAHGVITDRTDVAVEAISTHSELQRPHRCGADAIAKATAQTRTQLPSPPKYHIPQVQPYEPHHCVTPVCLALQAVGSLLLTHTHPLLLLVVVAATLGTPAVLLLCAGRWLRALLWRRPATSPKAKSKRKKAQ